MQVIDDQDEGTAGHRELGQYLIDGVVHRGGYDPPALLAALATSE